jgi:hypothetical protein
MHHPRTTAAICAMAAVGLVVSILAVGSWYADRESLAPTDPGAVAAVDLRDPGRDRAGGGARERAGERSRGRAGPQQVGRSTATLDGAGRRAGRPAPRPVQVAVPAVGIDLPVRPVGVADDGQMALPDDPAVAGWYRFGPGPGERGSVVLAGHLDSVRFGVGPLVRLREVEVGQRIEVTVDRRRGAAARTLTYVVQRVDRFDRQALPAALFARTGPERLRLVTCGGAFDPDAGGYEQNLVVTAVPLTP